MTRPSSTTPTALAMAAAVAAILAAEPAAAQRVQTAVLPDAITVGDVFRAAIRIELDDAAQAAHVVAPDSLALAPDLELAGRREARTDTVDGVTRVTFVYPLTAWRPGSYTLPEVTLQLVRGDSSVAFSAALPGFDVRSVLPADTAGIQPEPAKDVLGASRLWWPLLLGLLSALLAAAAAYVWWRRRRRGDSAAPVTVPAAPPREAALARLAELRGSGLLERGEVKPYYEALSETLRRYAATVDPAWGVELTTSELSQRLRASKRIDIGLALELTRVLGAADLVKFAQAQPAVGAAAQDLDAARQWIERVPAPVAVAPEAAPERRAA